MLKRSKFLFERWAAGGPQAPDEPHFDSPETTAWFSNMLADATRFLEYGSGGSTYLAAKLGVEFASVESDAAFHAAVRKKITDEGLSRPGQVFHHADIGPTGYWGRPVGMVTKSRLQKFRRYSDAPTMTGPPDLVLIDGRFRVACALKAFRDFPDATIVVDDYLPRPDYVVLEVFAEVRMVGRMAVFTNPRPHPRRDELITVWEIRRD